MMDTVKMSRVVWHNLRIESLVANRVISNCFLQVLLVGNGLFSCTGQCTLVWLTVSCDQVVV